MPGRSVLLAVLALAVALPAAPAAAACAGADTTLSLASVESARDAVLCLVNEERASRGLGALEHDALLQVAAQAHSEDMVLRDYFDHYTPDGRDPGDRLDIAGYDWASYGENIAIGQRSPREVMEAWMDSPGHRANILGSQFTELGVGISLVAATFGGNGGTWTQNFGRPRGVEEPDAIEIVDETVDGVPVEEEAPAPEQEAPVPAGDDASAATAPLTAEVVRRGAFLRIAGRFSAQRVRVRVVQQGRTVARKRVRVKGGRYRAWVAVPSGPLKVVVRGGGRRVVRSIA